MPTKNTTVRSKATATPKVAAARRSAGGIRDDAGILQMIAGNIKSHLHKSKLGIMHETFNPLWNINSRQAQMIYDLARSGNFAQLQYLYNEIENCDPTFNVCVTRRCSALSELDWNVVESDQRGAGRRNADAALAKEQIECLEDAIAHIDNMPDALEHFALSAFRGFSLVNVWRDLSGLPCHLECIDHWNVAFDRYAQSWLFNKDAISFMNPRTDNPQMTAIPREDMVVVTRKRQIDWPAIQIFLRNAIGERDWGRFLETYGLPPVIITMPEFTSKDDQSAYIEAAAAVFEGRSGVVPFGSEVNYASESRGTDPFSAFIEHQMKLFVLLATGGTLTSLSEAGSGTLAGNAQMEVWRQIVRADVRLVSNAINKQLCEGILRDKFKGQPMLAEFRLDAEPKPTAKDMLELAGMANSAGFDMDAEELSQACGFKITKHVESGGAFNAALTDPGITIQAGTHAEDNPPVPNANPAASAGGDTASVLNRLVNAVENLQRRIDEGQSPIIASKAATTPNTALPAARTNDDAVNAGTPDVADKTPAPSATEMAEDLARSLQADFKPVADEIVKILAAPESEQAGMAASLLQRIDSLVPDDPAMAEVIAEQMTDAFKRQMEKQPHGDAPAANRAVPNAMVAFNGHNPPCDICGYETRKDGGCTHCERHHVSKSVDEEGHTPEQQHSIAQYESSTNKEIVDFVKAMDNLPNEVRNKAKIKICTASEKLSADIKRETGIDTSGWDVVLQGNHIKHIGNRHGGTGNADKTMADVNHFGRMGYVMSNYDSLKLLKDDRGNLVKSEEYKGKDGKPACIVEISKQIDGKLVIQQAVPDSKTKTLKIVSAYIKKS